MKSGTTGVVFLARPLASADRPAAEFCRSGPIPSPGIEARINIIDIEEMIQAPHSMRMTDLLRRAYQCASWLGHRVLCRGSLIEEHGECDVPLGWMHRPASFGDASPGTFAMQVIDRRAI